MARAAAAIDLPYLPGISTATGITTGFELGLNRFKFFPAAAAGGIVALRALAAPFKSARFCPTGGIDAGSAAEWLREPA